MRHLNEGVLRRLLDEPFSVSSSSRVHLAGCDECQRTMRDIERNATVAQAVLSADDLHLNAANALQQLRARIESGNVQSARAWRKFFSRRASLGYQGKPQWLAAGGLAAALVASLALTPAGSFAQSFITIFQAKHVAAIPVTTADLQSLPSLNKYGTTHLSAKLKPFKLSSVAAARTQAHYKVLTLLVLPGGTPKSATYTVVPGAAGTFTFSANKARAAERGQQIPTMPSGLDGSTLKVQLGTAVIAVYGSATSGIPPLAVGQMPAPKVSSTGVSVKEIEKYVLGLPGVSPNLAASIRAIGDPASVLPIPIPIDKASSQSVTVQGVPGLLIGDSTGIGSVIIWQKDGMIYGIGGAQTQDSILSVANSLH